MGAVEVAELDWTRAADFFDARWAEVLGFRA